MISSQTLFICCIAEWLNSLISAKSQPSSITHCHLSEGPATEHSSVIEICSAPVPNTEHYSVIMPWLSDITHLSEGCGPVIHNTYHMEMSLSMVLNSFIIMLHFCPWYWTKVQLSAEFAPVCVPDSLHYMTVSLSVMDTYFICSCPWY